MNDYKHSETIKSVIEDIDASGDVVFQDTFRNRLWVPIVLTAMFISTSVIQLLFGEGTVETVFDFALSVILIGVVWWLQYAQAAIAASESKYAHAMSYLDELEDEPDA